MSIDVEKTVREYIDKTVHLSLATTKNGFPWVCEVHFAFDNELNLYFRSLPSRRHSQEIAANPNVAGNIVKQHALSETVVGVYFEGSARLLTSVQEQKTAFQSLESRLGLDNSAIEEARKRDGHKFYKISVKNWYVFGRFGEPSGKKYKLEWNPD